MTTGPVTPSISSTSSASSPPAPTARAHGRGPRIGLAVGLGLVGILAALLWAGTTQTGTTASIAAATHGEAQGVVVTVHPDPYVVYTEDGTTVSAISVTAPDGTSVPVTLTSKAFTYGPHREGRQVGTFEVPVGAGLADYRVVVTTSDQRGDAPIAVTTFDVARFNRWNGWGIVVLLATNLGVAAVLVGSTMDGRRRRRAS